MSFFLFFKFIFSNTSETETNFSKISKNSYGNKIKIFGKKTEEIVIYFAKQCKFSSKNTKLKIIFS